MENIYQISKVLEMTNKAIHNGTSEQKERKMIFYVLKIWSWNLKISKNTYLELEKRCMIKMKRLK